MTPDQWRRTDIERAFQLMSDEYDARQAERAGTLGKCLTVFRWIGLTMGAGAGAYCLWTLIVWLVTP